MASEKLNILHVLSQTELTGAETYAIEIAEEQKKSGHSLFMISDKIHTESTIPLVTQPISKRSYFQRSKNILFLRSFIKKNKIDVIHAHSRAASWVCNLAALGTKTAYISSVHGRQHIHFSSRTQDIYGDRIIAVCENLKTHLEQELHLSGNNITVIPNGIDFSFGSFDKKSDDMIRFSILGRTSGPKGKRTEAIIDDVLPALLKKIPKLEVIVAGGPLSNLSAISQENFNSLIRQYPGRVKNLGVLPYKDFVSIINSSSAVLGSGRVAIKALALGKAVFAIGESCVPGWITAENLSEAAASNFGDICKLKSEVESTPNDLAATILLGFEKGLPLPHAEAFIHERYSVKKVTAAIEKEYRLALFRRYVKNWIPVLMYHKVESQPVQSRHRIFVSADRFDSHLQFLRSRGFQSVTFNDLHYYLEGKLPWKTFPKKPVIITFDDGYESTFKNAVPSLSKYSFRAVFFVMGNALLRHNVWDTKEGEPESSLMDPALIPSLLKDGHEVGAHSMNHPKLTELNDDETMKEIIESKIAVENLTGTSPKSFAYPYGNLDGRVKQLVSRAGFTFGIATDSGGLHLTEDPMQIFRASVFPEDGKYQIWKKTSPWYRGYYRWKRGK